MKGTAQKEGYPLSEPHIQCSFHCTNVYKNLSPIEILFLERSVATSYLLLKGFSHLLDPCALDELRQFKWWLLNAPLALQVFALETPVPRDWDGVTGGLQVD